MAAGSNAGCFVYDTYSFSLLFSMLFLILSLLFTLLAVLCSSNAFVGVNTYLMLLSNSIWFTSLMRIAY